MLQLNIEQLAATVVISGDGAPSATAFVAGPAIVHPKLSVGDSNSL